MATMRRAVRALVESVAVGVQKDAERSLDTIEDMLYRAMSDSGMAKQFSSRATTKGGQQYDYVRFFNFDTKDGKRREVASVHLATDPGGKLTAIEVRAGDRWGEGFPLGKEKDAATAIMAVVGPKIGIIKEERGTPGGARQTWVEFEMDAQAAFLQVAAAIIRREAGARASKVEVTRDRSVAWLEYQGEDRSDLDLTWTGSVVVDGPKVLLHAEWGGAQLGTRSASRDLRLTAGVATPEHLVDLWREAFGR